MPLLSDIARKKKISHFITRIPKEARVLEIGCGDGWLGEYCRSHGWAGYVGLDLHPPADVVGDIREWRSLGIAEGAFDVIIAFEVFEHIWCFRECFDILRPGGLLMATTPHPRMDWLCRALEFVGLNQKRTSPHDHLVRLRDVPLFEPVDLRFVPPLAQWGIFRRPDGPAPAAAAP